MSGALGDQFLQEETDFLLKFSYFIWRKYVVQAILQSHHVYEMKLTGEITDGHFGIYEKLLRRFKEILLPGLKLLNTVLMSSSSPDIIWISK